jgi:hypothetical protein
MNDTERENLEIKILLRSTGELPSAEMAALERVLASDAEAAAFARFVAAKLPARAPRDFAAAAIHAALRKREAAAFSQIRERIAAAIRRTWPMQDGPAVSGVWKFAGAATAVVVTVVAVKFFIPNKLPPVASAQPPQRTTAHISAHTDTLESEIADARQRVTRGRFHHPTEL